MRERMKIFLRVVCCVLLLAGMPVLTQRAEAAMTQVSVQETVEIKGIDGQTCTPSSFGEDVVALFFGRTGCWNTQNMIAAAEEMHGNGCSVKIVLLCVDDTDSGMEDFAKAHPDVLVAGPQYNSVMWTLLRECGLADGDGIMLPGTFLMDKSRTIVYASTGYDADGLKQALTAAAALPETDETENGSGSQTDETENGSGGQTDETENSPGSQTDETENKPGGTGDKNDEAEDKTGGTEGGNGTAAGGQTVAGTSGTADRKPGGVAKPKTPQFTSVKRKARTKAVLRWKKVPGADGYEIQMSKSKKKGFKRIKRGLAGKRTYTKKGLSGKKKYYFRIRSYRKVNGGYVYSKWSKVKKI